jgi:hypothetical protein
MNPGELHKRNNGEIGRYLEQCDSCQSQINFVGQSVISSFHQSPVANLRAWFGDTDAWTNTMECNAGSHTIDDRMPVPA